MFACHFHFDKCVHVVDKFKTDFDVLTLLPSGLLVAFNWPHHSSPCFRKCPIFQKVLLEIECGQVAFREESRPAAALPSLFFCFKTETCTWLFGSPINVFPPEVVKGWETAQ